MAKTSKQAGNEPSSSDAQIDGQLTDLPDSTNAAEHAAQVKGGYENMFVVEIGLKSRPTPPRSLI